MKSVSNLSSDLASKIVLAHKGFFNKESEHLYRENSKEVCEVSSQKDYIQIIELDVRKSADGVLYCFHGNFFQYYFVLKIVKSFSALRKKYGVDRLDEILAVLPENKSIFLDLKSESITKADILDVFADRKFKEIIIGNTAASVASLDRFDDMPRGFVKIMNGNIFCKFYNLKKLRDKNYKYFEVVFPFQVSRTIIRKVIENGMEFRCAGLFFRNKESYWNKINKYNIKNVSSDFI